jgi:hypothetical protein
MANSPHIRKLREIAEGLLEIPANEQCIGHLQVAIQKALWEIADELERHGKIMGVESGR